MRPTVADIVVSLEAPPLVVDDLRFVHDGTRFGPLSMQLQPGEQATLVLAAALLRPPLLQALLGLCAVESGSVEIAGVDLLRCGDRDRLLLRRMVGYMPLQGALLANLGLDANLALLARHHLDLHGDALARRMAELSDLLELPPLGGRRLADAPLELQRRVALGRVLATRPRLLLLDDPTVGLGTRRAAAFWAIVSRVRAETGTAVLAITSTAPPSSFANVDLVLPSAAMSAAQERA